MERGTGLCDLAIWYPDQDPMKIVPYPWTIRTSEKATGDNITINGIHLVNPYQAIKIGPEWNELHTIRNVFGTPLKAGIWMDTCTDIGRVTGVGFGPAVWQGSGLPGSPKEEQEFEGYRPLPEGVAVDAVAANEAAAKKVAANPAAAEALRDFLYREGVAYEIRRSDWEYLYGIVSYGYAVGLVIRPGQQGAANAVLYGSRLDAKTALRLEGLNEAGLSVTGTALFGQDSGVHATASFNSTALFSGFQ